MNYKISIIISVYNREKFLKQCLDSIVNQTIGIENIEVIIVNDKSTDNSLNILEQYARKYPSIKIINHEVNKGVGEAKNTAMKHVTADYLMFVDSDDYINENIIENSLNLIGDSDLLIFNWQRFPQDEYSIYNSNIGENKTITSISEMPSLAFSTSNCNKIFRKNLYKYLKFSSKLYEDNIPSLEILFNAKKIFLNKDIGYFYRKHNESITNEINLQNVLDLTSVVGNLFKLAKKYPDEEKFIKLLILRFVDDIIFWLNYYDWYYTEELEIVENLQKVMLSNIYQKDIDFYYSVANLEILNPEYILNLNNYDAETFLARYLYLLNSPKINPVATLYVDVGEGFSEENKVSIKYNLQRTNDLTFDLNKFKNIKQLRFDPIEGELIQSKIITTEPITNRSSSNSDNGILDEYQLFFTLDPNYVLDGDFKNIEKLNIKFKLNILNNKQLSEILLNKNTPKKKESKGFLNRLLR